MQYGEETRSREAIGKRIAELREEKNLSQKKMGEMLFSNRSNVNNYEHGKGDINIELIMALSDLFDRSTDYILTGVEPENRTTAADLGLSDESIKYLKEDDEHIHNCVNYLLTHPAGRRLLFQIGWYIGQQYEKTVTGITSSGQPVDLDGLAIPGIDEQGQVTTYFAPIKSNALTGTLGEAMERAYLDKMIDTIRQLKGTFQEEAASKVKRNGGKKNAEEE